MKYLLPLLILLAANCSALARLGETQAEVEARFGKGTDTLIFVNNDKIKEFSYVYNGVKINVTYFNGKSASETYTNHPAFSEEDMKRFLELNNTLGMVDGMKPSWKMDDGVKKDVQGQILPSQTLIWNLGTIKKTVAVATSSFPYVDFTITTVEFSDYLKTLKQEKEATPALKGF